MPFQKPEGQLLCIHNQINQVTCCSFSLDVPALQTCIIHCSTATDCQSVLYDENLFLCHMFNQSQRVTSGDKSQITYAEREDCTWAGAQSEVLNEVTKMIYLCNE